MKLKEDNFKCPDLEHYVVDVFLMVRIVNKMLYYFKLFNIPLWVKDPKPKAVVRDTAPEDDDETFHIPKEGYKINK